MEEAEPKDLDDGTEPVNTELKGIPKVLSLFVPTQSDGLSEIIRKGLLVICFVIIIVSVVVLVKSTKQPAGEDDIGSNFVTRYVYSYQINRNQSTENG